MLRAHIQPLLDIENVAFMYSLHPVDSLYAPAEKRTRSLSETSRSLAKSESLTLQVSCCLGHPHSTTEYKLEMKERIWCFCEGNLCISTDWPRIECMCLLPWYEYVSQTRTWGIIPVHTQSDAERSYFAQLGDLCSTSVGLGHHFSAPLGKGRAGHLWRNVARL